MENGIKIDVTNLSTVELSEVMEGYSLAGYEPHIEAEADKVFIVLELRV